MNEARSCAERKLDLIALLDGELTPATKAELDAHVLGCADCRADLAELEATSTFLRKWEPVDPPRDLAPAISAPRPIQAPSGPRFAVVPGRRFRELFLPAGLGAALAAAAVVLLFRLGGMSAGNSELKEIHALGAEVAALRTELAAAQSALAQARTQVPDGATVTEAPLAATSPTAPAGAPPLTLTAADREALLKHVAAAIAESESRQDTKFLFTTDQLARSLSMQRREDLATIERQLRDSRAETFQALVTTHERLDRLAQPALLEQGIAPRTPGNGALEHNGDDERSLPAEERLEPNSRK